MVGQTRAKNGGQVKRFWAVIGKYFSTIIYPYGFIGMIVGSVIMTGYRRAPLKQIFLETVLYICSFAGMMICAILRVIGVITVPGCYLDYPSDKCAPLGCNPMATNQDI